MRWPGVYTVNTEMFARYLIRDFRDPVQIANINTRKHIKKNKKNIKKKKQRER